eukprot:m.7791 g.7791  ORF g.7791 m.7791 type:complete len:1119 (+) comp19654_c0_seq1:32-3388(+)
MSRFPPKSSSPHPRPRSESGFFGSQDSDLPAFGSADSSLAESSCTDVYLCYDKSKIGRQTALQLHKALEKRCPGIKVFSEGLSIHWGESVMAKVQKNIASTRIAVVVISEESTESTDQRAQLNALIARQCDRRTPFIYPLLVGNANVDEIRKVWPVIADLQALSLDSTDLDEISAVIQRKLESVEYVRSESGRRKRWLQSDSKKGLPMLPPCCERQELVSHILRALEDPSFHVYHLYGLPGIGKSMVAKLVTQAAAAQNWAFLYLPVSKVDSVPSLRVLTERKANVKNIFSEGGSALVIFDGADRLIDQEASDLVEFCDDLLQQADQLKILITSRSQFTTMKQPLKEIDARPLAIEESMQFLERELPKGTIAGRRHSIAKFSHGHPMLLHVFVILIRKYGVTAKELIQRMTSVRPKPWDWLEEKLSDSDIVSEDRIDCIFSVAIETLGDGKIQGSAVCVAAFPGNFTTEAADTILDKGIARRLVQKSLLFQQESGRRFCMNPVFRSFLHKMAKDKFSRLLEEVKHKYYCFYLTKLLDVMKGYSLDASSTLRMYEEDKHNFETVLKCDVIPADLQGLFIEAVLQVGPLLKLSCWTCEELISLYYAACELAASQNQKTIYGRLQIQRADVYIRQGQGEKSIDELKELKKAFASLKEKSDEDHLALAACYSTLGNAYRCLGKLEVALRYLNKAKAIFPRISQQPECLVATIMALGDTQVDLGNVEEARKLYMEALGVCKRRLGKTPAKNAKPKGRMAFAKYQKGIHPSTVEIQLRMAELEGQAGRYRKALECLDNINCIEDQLQFNVICPSILLDTRGAIAYLNGDEEGGIELMDDALRKNSGDHFLRFFTAFKLGKVYYGRKDYDRALSYLKEALQAAEICSYQGDAYLKALAYSSSVANKMGQNGKAKEFSKLLSLHLASYAETKEEAHWLLSVQIDESSVRADFCCWLYGRFCCKHGCLDAISTSPASPPVFGHLPFCDPGRSNFKLRWDPLPTCELLAVVSLPTPLGNEESILRKCVDQREVLGARRDDDTPDHSFQEWLQPSTSSTQSSSNSDMKRSVSLPSGQSDSSPVNLIKSHSLNYRRHSSSHAVRPSLLKLGRSKTMVEDQRVKEEEQQDT